MTSERRRFFRIDDTMGVAYRLLTEEEVNQSDKIERPVNPFSLISSYNNKIESCLAQLRIKEPLVAEVLDTLNKKIDVVLSQTELESSLVERLAHKIQEVNISACGLAFVVEEHIDPDRVISLDLALTPSNLHVFILATVVTCEPAKDQGYYFLRVKYTHISHADQETLIQHIVKRQGTLIRMLREGEHLEKEDSGG